MQTVAEQHGSKNRTCMYLSNGAFPHNNNCTAEKVQIRIKGKIIEMQQDFKMPNATYMLFKYGIHSQNAPWQDWSVPVLYP